MQIKYFQTVAIAVVTAVAVMSEARCETEADCLQACDNVYERCIEDQPSDRYAPCDALDLACREKCKKNQFIME